MSDLGDCGATDETAVSPAAMREAMRQLVEAGQSGPHCTVDCHSALQRLGGDWELFRELLGFFFSDWPGLIETMRAAIASRDAERLHHAAHQLKGLVSNFEAEHAIAAALRLEQLGSGGTLDDAPQCFERLERTMSVVNSVLRRLTPASLP